MPGSIKEVAKGLLGISEIGLLAGEDLSLPNPKSPILRPVDNMFTLLLKPLPWSGSSK